MKFEEPDLDLIPKPNHVRRPWQGFTDLRISLFERGMIKNALMVFRVELHRTPLEKRPASAEEVIDLLDRLPDLPHRAFMLADVRERFADTLVSLHDQPRAKEMALDCDLALNQWCAENEVASKDHLPLYLNLQYTKINFIADLLEKLTFVEALLPFSDAARQRKFSELLDTAAWTALALAERSNPQEYLAKFYSFRERGEQEDEIVQEDLCNLILHRHDLTPVLQGLLDRQKELEWIDGFFVKYPDFHPPAMMIQLYTRRVILFHSLNDTEGAEKSQKILDRWSLLAPTTRGLFHRSWANVAAPGDGAVGEAQYDSEDEIDEGQSISEFSKIGSGPNDQLEITQKLLRFLIDWAIEDAQRGLLDCKQLQELFDLSDGELGEIDVVSLQKLRDILKTREPGTMFKALFLPKDTKDQVSDHRFSTLR